MSWEALGTSSSDSFLLVLTECASLAGAGCTLAEPRFSPLWFPSLLIVFPSPISGSGSALSMLNMLNPRSNSLGKNLTFNLLVCNIFNSMLSDTLDSSSFAMATCMGPSFWNSTHSLDGYNLTFPPELQVCGNKNNSMISKRSREHTSDVSHPPFGWETANYDACVWQITGW